jgi:PAS domain S-box-containing protein
MGERLEYPAEEIQLLRRCINDLTSVIGLPALWTGGEPSRIVRTLLEVLPDMLYLDLLFVRLEDPAGKAPLEMGRVANPQNLATGPQEIGALLKQCLGADPKRWPPVAKNRFWGEDISIMSLPLGLQGEIGIIVAGSRCQDFPKQTEALLLSIAANQAALGLREARLWSEQKQVANELDQRVAQRTSELAAINKQLKEEIAERKLAEERLRKEEGELKRSEARKTAILDSALDCIVTIDHEGRIIEFNPAAERSFGHHRDDVVGKHMADVIIPPALRNQHRQAFARYLATNEAKVLGKRLEMTAVRADGSEFPVELTITRIPLPDEPPSFTGYLRDITERKQSEEKLRRSEAYLAEAQKLSHTGSFGWNVPADEHFWSDETFRIFEFDVSARVTLHMILERIHPEDLPVVKQVIERASHDGKDWEHEYRLLMPNGAVKYVQVVAHAISNKSGNLEFVGAVMDITASRRAEEALRRGRADLAHVSRMTILGELTASIAHEVSQPLGSVMNNAHACLNLLPGDAPSIFELREALKEIIEGADRAIAVITRVRQLAKKVPCERILINLNDVVTDIMALTRAEAKARKVTIHTDLTDDLPPVFGDRVQLQQVLLNLVVNGMDAMNTIEVPKRVLVISGRCEIREGTHRCLLSVEDKGTGFSPEESDRLFEAFYSTKPEGMGMGLAISRSIIEDHGGHLWAETNQGPGATFLFSLPEALNAKS